MGEKTKVGLSKTKMVKKDEAGQSGPKQVKVGHNGSRQVKVFVKLGQSGSKQVKI